MGKRGTWKEVDKRKREWAFGLLVLIVILEAWLDGWAR